MAKNTSASLDKWREYFRTANSGIFDIIEKAIMVAASDCPYDFKLKRDRIAEVLFSCKVTKCFGCDKLELAVPSGECPEKSNEKYKSGIEAGGSKDTKESKVNSSPDDGDDDDHREVMAINVNQVRDDSYGDVEALNDEIEEESQFYGEVLRIKEVLDNHKDQPDSLLFDSLRRLQLMPLSVETLKATEIGKSVYILRKHGSMEVRSIARSLIEDWKIMVDSWVESTKAIADAEIRPESVKTSVVEEEEGLPSPPLDEGAFFTTPTSMELSQFFDGMDDDGNPRNCGEFNKNRGNGRNMANVEKTGNRKPKIETREDSHPPPKDRRGEQYRNPETVVKKPSQAQTPPKPSGSVGSQRGPGLLRPSHHEPVSVRPKPAVNPKPNREIQAQQKFETGSVQKKPEPSQKEKLNCSNETSVHMKLEAAKRKLQERYQEAENAKKQRTIQVVEIRDLPKQSVIQRNLQMKPGNHNRNWANGRR